MKLWVLDTNVVVSGLLNPHGPSARVLDAVLDGRLKLVYDARILAEYRDVLHRPRLNLAPAKITAFLNGLQGQAMVTPSPLAVSGPDPDDIVFIEAALTTTDKTLVTGNLADYPPKILHGARVLTPAQAQRNYLPTSILETMRRQRRTPVDMERQGRTFGRTFASFRHSIS